MGACWVEFQAGPGTLPSQLQPLPPAICTQEGVTLLNAVLERDLDCRIFSINTAAIGLNGKIPGRKEAL